MDPQAMQKLIQILQSRGGPAQQMAQPAAPPTQQTPERIGQTPNVMTPPNIVWDPKTAIGNMPPPAAQQQTGAPRYQPDAGMSQAMMAHLDPKGAATFSAIQGIGQFLGQVSEKRQKNQAAEAANLAQSLMTAIDSKDISGMTAIMGDPKKMKLIDKVYKGWIQKAEEASQPQEPQKPEDPDVAGFNKGIADHAASKVQGGAPQQGQPPQQPPLQRNDAQGTPRSIGGYLVPHAGPGQQMKNITDSSQVQYAKAHPESAIEGPMTPQRVQQEEILAAKMDEAKSKAVEAGNKAMQAEQGVKASIVRYQTVMQAGANAAQKQGFDIQKTQLEVNKAREEVQKSLVQSDIARTDLQTHKEILINTIMKGKNQQEKDKKVKGLPLKEQEKLYSLDKADKLLDQMQANGTVTSSDVADLQAVFAAAGANRLSQALPGLYKQNAPKWAGGADEDTIKGIRSAVSAFREGVQKAADTNFPGWRKDSKAPDAQAPPPAAADDEDDGDVEEINLMPKEEPVEK